MIPSIREIEALHRKYAANDLLYTRVYDHCRVVAEIALWCADQVPNEKVDRKLLETAALLHDIGSYGFMSDKDGSIANHHTYAQHAMLGADILRKEGMDERLAQTIETHIQMGLTKEDIKELKRGMPVVDMTPKSLEAEIRCYADRFHSKRPKFNAYNTYLAFLKEVFPASQAEKLEQAAQKFGIPDLEALSKKYGHPIV
jgi:uncharacterized protein